MVFVSTIGFYFYAGEGTSPSVLAKEVKNKEAKLLQHVVRNAAFQKYPRHARAYLCAALFSLFGVKGWKPCVQILQV